MIHGVNNKKFETNKALDFSVTSGATKLHVYFWYSHFQVIRIFLISAIKCTYDIGQGGVYIYRHIYLELISVIVFLGDNAGNDTYANLDDLTIIDTPNGSATTYHLTLARQSIELTAGYTYMIKAIPNGA